MSVKITYHGHACFTLESNGYIIALDPYDDHVPGYKPLAISANNMYFSHGHMDHCYGDAVNVIKGGTDPFTVTEILSYHDDKKGALRGENTIRIFEADGIRVAHLGDLGCEPEEEQIKLLSGLDAVMIPVGGYYTIDSPTADAIINMIMPKVVIPMHYRSGDLGLPVISDLNAFTSLRNDVKTYDQNSIEITKDTPAQTAVLKYI